MNQSDIPARFPIPFANNAGGAYIRTIPQAHVAPSGSDAPASLYDGFPPETFTALGAGGVPPSGKDFNGLLNQVTAWARWQAAGGPAVFNSSFSTSIGGYPKGAQVASTVTAGKIWVSTADANTTDPDGGSPANWVALQPATASQAPITITINANGWAFGINIGGTTYYVQCCKVNCNTSGGTAFSWPVAFPTQVFVAVAGSSPGLNFVGSQSPYLYGVTTSGGTAYGSNGGGVSTTTNIIAIGN